MKQFLLGIIFITLGVQVHAQEDAWVYFTDKPDAAYYMGNPLEMLSQKALDRRAAQNIALDETDVPVNQGYINTVTNAPGITVMARSKWLNALHIRGTESDINALAELSFVESIDFASNNLSDTGKPAHVSQHNMVNKQLDIQAEYAYGGSASQIQMLNGHLLHEADFTGTGMTIAVLDAGFPDTDTSPALQNLYDNNLVLGGYNYVAASENVYQGGSHGTLILSTMAGYVEGELVGTAPNAFYYFFVTEDVTSENPVEESYWVEAAEAADSLGADIINTSLGYFEYDNPAYSHTYEDIDGQTAFITRGANIAFTKGMFLVTSAGNSGATENPHIGVPADAFNTLTLGAVDSAEQYALFSSIGPSFDGRVKPDVMAQGQGSTYATLDGSIGTGNGTSFSSPITAGLVACLWQALPGLTNAELLQLIRQSADRYNNPDEFYGYGIPDFWAAYQSALGTAEVTKNAFSVYPNPAEAVVKIAFPKDIDSGIIMLYNSLGQLIFQKAITLDNSYVSVEALPTGIYSYAIECGDKSVSGKLVKK
ncbi:S8 family serine peptidase [Flavobacterium sp. RHBU_24]|uniref:S8 family serine peptidase n=1 Tax=Flavobacterium sp. RHBU_24 TaxID=3391185 RepID=UPI0039846E83